MQGYHGSRNLHARRHDNNCPRVLQDAGWWSSDGSDRVRSPMCDPKPFKTNNVVASQCSQSAGERRQDGSLCPKNADNTQDAALCCAAVVSVVEC